MKILVLSDTHGIIDNLKKLFATIDIGTFDAVFHLGDGAGDLTGFNIKIPVYQVNGNCDYSSYHKDTELVELEQVKVLLLHGHTHHVKYGLMGIMYAAEEKQVDIAFFGHTHLPYLEEASHVTLCNPGSLGFPRGGHPSSYAVLNIDGDSFAIKHYTL